jgi:restriction system protein
MTAFAFLFTTAFVGWLAIRYAAAAPSFSRLPSDWLSSLGLFTGSALLTLLLFWILLFWQWRRQSVGPRLPVMTVEQLTVISPHAFEQFVGEIFERRGYQVVHRGRSGDLGVDLELLNPNGRRAIVQCKRYRNTVGPEIVRELFGTMLHELADHGFLVTTAEVSDAARDWARNKPITLIDGETLVGIARELAGS